MDGNMQNLVDKFRAVERARFNLAKKEAELEWAVIHGLEGQEGEYLRLTEPIREEYDRRIARIKRPDIGRILREEAKRRSQEAAK